MMKKNISIHDIAKHLSISSATVSLVLNGKAEENKIRKEVSDKIHAYVKEVGYRPNLVAKSLRTGKTHIIGMLVESIADPFFSSIAEGIERRAYKLGYKIFFASTENETDKAKALIQVFRERQVDAFIIAPPPGIEKDIQALIDDACPVILFDRYFPAINTDRVVVNNYEGAYQAVKYLQESGYENIGFVTLESDQTQMADRLNGYLKAIKESKQKKLLLRVDYTLEDDVRIEKVKQFLSTHPTLEAVLFGTNYLALNGLAAISSLKLSIPKDVAVISFDDSALFPLLSPTITAIAQPIDAISEAVIKRVMTCLNHTDADSKTESIALETEFIIRNSSTKKVKKKAVVQGSFSEKN